MCLNVYALYVHVAMVRPYNNDNIKHGEVTDDN